LSIHYILNTHTHLHTTYIFIYITMYRIRIDERPHFTASNLEELLKEAKAFVIVRHELPTGNPHFHAYAEIDLKEQTLRQRIKRADVQKGDYSLKLCDPIRINEYVQYMFNTKHGNRWELLGFNNFDSTLLDTLKANAQQISDDFADVHKNKSKGPTIWDIAMEVQSKFEGTNGLEGNRLRYTGRGLEEDYQEDSENEKRMIRVYTEITIQILRGHRKAFDEFLIRKVISTAMSSSDSGKDILVKKMFKNFCLHY